VSVGVRVGVFDGVLVGVFDGVLVGVSDGVSVGVAVGVSVWVLVGVTVGVIVGVLLGVAVGVSVGELVGVTVPVLVGVIVGVLVAVRVGVDVGVLVGSTPLSAPTTSPAELPFLFHVPRIFQIPDDDSWAEIDCGVLLELTVVALDHDEYGLEDSEYFTVPLSTNQLTKSEEMEYIPAARDETVPVKTEFTDPHEAGDPEYVLSFTSSASSI
jgi:hypothetical protein